MAKSSDPLPEDTFIFFHGEENVQKHASASYMEEQAFQSADRLKTKANFHYCTSAAPDMHSCP